MKRYKGMQNLGVRKKENNFDAKKEKAIAVEVS